MIKNILTILSVLFTLSSLAQAPEKFTYQAVVRDASNNLITNTTLGLRISILQGSETGTAVYTETHSPTTNNGGLMIVEIGTGTTSDNFTVIDWSAGPYYLKRQIDPLGGNTYTIEGTEQLQSVSYALHTKSAETVTSLSDGNIYIGNALGIATQVNFSGDATMSNSGLINLNSGSIGSSEVADNSLTVDDLGTGSVTSIEIADGGIEGIDLNKSAIPLSGFGPATSTIDLGNQLITNIADPVTGQDVANKAYVDAQILELRNDLKAAGVMPYEIGDEVLGGIVAYIFQPGDPGYIVDEIHGLIAAPTDQSTGSEWGCFGASISGADGEVLGAGEQNTLDIIAGCSTPGIAAQLCNDLVLNGYDDWYLPSKDELNKLYEMKVLGFGAFASWSYWSSTEFDGSYAWAQFFPDGLQFNTQTKSSNINVRAIRAF